MSGNDFYGNQQGYGYGAPPGQYQYQQPYQQPPPQQGHSGYPPGAAPPSTGSPYPEQSPYTAPQGDHASSRDLTQYSQTGTPAPYYQSPSSDAYGSPSPHVNSPYPQPQYPGQAGYHDPSGRYQQPQQQLQPYSQSQPPQQYQSSSSQGGSASDFYGGPPPPDTSRGWQNQPHQQQSHQAHDQHGQYVDNTAPGDRGIGSTVLGGTAGAFIGKKLGFGKLGGAAAGAVLANVMNHHKKK